MGGWVDGRERGRKIWWSQTLGISPSFLLSFPPSIVVPSSRSFSFGCDVSERRLPDGGDDSHHNAEVKLALSVPSSGLSPSAPFISPFILLFYVFPLIAAAVDGQRTDLFKRGGGGSWSYLPFFCPATLFPVPPASTPSSAPSLTSAKMVMKMRKTAANGMAMGGTGNGEAGRLDGGGREQPTRPPNVTFW